MAPSLQERFGIRKKKIFDAFDDSSYLSEEVGDLDAPGSAELNVSSLEPTKEEPEEDQEQAPSLLTNERAPSVLGRLLGKHTPSPRKSSKNSFQSRMSRLTKEAQSNLSVDIASTPAAAAEDAPQSPTKQKRKSTKKPKRKSIQCKQSLLDDSGSDESLSDDDGYRPSKGMTELTSLEDPSLHTPISLEGPSLHKNCDHAELSSSHPRGDQKERRKVLAAPSRQDLMDMDCDHAELTSSHPRGDQKERRKVLAAPSREDLMDMALASQNDPNSSETASAKPKRRGARRSNKPQGAQFMPSLMSADAHSESEGAVSPKVDDGGSTPMGRRPSLLSAPSQSTDFVGDGDSTEDDDSSESSHPAAPIPHDSNNGGGDEKKDDHNSVIESQSVPSQSEAIGYWNVKNPEVKKRRGSGRRSKEPQSKSDPDGCRSSDSVVESQSVVSPSEAGSYWNGKNPEVKAPAKTKRTNGRRQKEAQPTSDPECEGEGSSDENDDGYLPTSMSSRPVILPAPSQSSLAGDVFDNGDNSKDNQSSEPSPHADQSQASLDCCLSDLGPDGTDSGYDSAVFSLSALEKKNHSSPAESLLKAEGDASTSKLDNSIQGLAMAFEDQEGGSESNLYISKVRQNRVTGPGEVDPSVRSTRSSLTFSVTVDRNGETQSINVDTRLPTIESPTKKTRGQCIRGDSKIADMSDNDAPSFAAKYAENSAENSSGHSQRSRTASPQKQSRDPPQIDLSEQESRSSPRQVSPRRQHQEHHSPESPKASRPSKSQPLHRKSKSSTPAEVISNTGPSREQMSISQHTPSAPRRKMAKSKGDTRVHPGPLVGGDDANQTDQGRENKVSTRSDKSEQASASRRHRAITKETGVVEENVSPTSVEGFSSPRRQHRKVTPTTTPKAASSRYLTPTTTPKAETSNHLFKVTTPSQSSNLFKATTPNPRSTRGLVKATTPNPRSTGRTATTPRRAQTPRGMSSRNLLDKSSEGYKKLMMGNSGGIGDLCSLREDEETTSKNLAPELIQNVKNIKNSNRPSENSERTSSLRNLIAESPRKTISSRNLIADSSRKTSSSKSVNPESSRKASSSRSVNPESLRRQGSSRSVNPESPRRTTSSRNVNPESPRRATSSRNLNPESPRKATSLRNLNRAWHGTGSSRNLYRASQEKTGSSRNEEKASPLNAGRDLLKRAQSSRMMPNSDWNYEPNRRHVTTAFGDDPDNRDRDANKTSARDLQQIPSIDIC